MISKAKLKDPLILSLSWMLSKCDFSGTIASLQEVHAELSSNKEATPEAIEEVKEMISEVEDKVCKTSKEQMQRRSKRNESRGAVARSSLLKPGKSSSMLLQPNNSPTLPPVSTRSSLTSLKKSEWQMEKRDSKLKKYFLN